MLEIEYEALKDREARCSSCGNTTPSINYEKLFMFEFTGKQSKAATLYCLNCGYHHSAHGVGTNKRICDNFVPHGPWEYDRYYCGCRGWD